MSSFLIKSFKDGLSDYEDKGLPGSFKFGSNIDIRKKVDSISAQQGLTDDMAVGNITSPPRFIVNSADGNAYISAGVKIYKRTSGGSYSPVYTDVGSDGDIAGMAEWVNDAGDTFLYWATATKLHRKRLIGSGYTNSNWSDVDATVNGQSYPKTNLTSTTWHTMAIVNGSLLIVNSGALAKVGWDDSYTLNAVQLYPGNVAKTIMESGVIAKVGANRTDDGDKSMVFVWDTDDQNFTDKLQLPFSGINAMVETEISIVQFGTDGALYFFGDTSRLPITSLPGGGQVDPDGVDSYNGLALLGVYGNGTGKSGIYTYGRTKKNDNFTLNCEYQFDCDAIYSVKVIGSDIIFTYKTTGADTYGVKKIDSSNKATKFTYQSLDLKAPDELQRVPVWSIVTLTMAPLPAGTSVEVWRKMDKTGEWLQCNTQDGSLTYSTEGGKEATFQIGDGGKYCELQVIGNCSGNSSPEVYKIQPFFN
jgi:hypothetical protein